LFEKNRHPAVPLQDGGPTIEKPLELLKYFQTTYTKFSDTIYHNQRKMQQINKVTPVKTGSNIR
jgi:hypothetical protein